ncbi:MAG: GNAT family N-acetyltransferase [Chloroflexia bacterium]|nr:GNAT family N-acetyltransferase [Chloroflexia bacterium]
MPTRVLGNISLSNFVRGPAKYFDLGYNVAATAQRQGLMTEAASGVIRYDFAKVELLRVSAAYLPHNRHSARLLERLEFTGEGNPREL